MGWGDPKKRYLCNQIFDPIQHDLGGLDLERRDPRGAHNLYMCEKLARGKKVGRSKRKGEERKWV